MIFFCNSTRRERHASPERGGVPQFFKTTPAVLTTGFEFTRGQKVSTTVLAGALLAICGAANAGPAVQLSHWSAEPSGTVTVDGETYDVRDDLQIEKEAATGVELSWGNWGLRWQSVDMEGEGTISAETTLLGLIPLGTAEAQVRSQIAFDEWQLSWLPLHWGVLRAGAVVKNLDGTLAAQEQNLDEARQVEQTFPMLALGARIPFGEALALQADGQWVAADDDEVYEWALSLQAQLGGLRAALGYRLQSYDIVEPNESVDATLRGMTLRLGWAF